MARIFNPSPEQEEGWREFVQSRPESVRLVAARFEPWSLYRLPNGQRVTIMSFGEQEDGTVTLRVAVTAEFNAVLFERQVFGINPDDLTSCDLPSPDERVGSMLTEVEVVENLDALRVMGRPDLWVMNADGHAILRETP